MKRRTWLALALSGLLAVMLTPAWSSAQAVVTAQILDFWRVLSVGGTFSGTLLSFNNLSIIANGHANFGTVLGDNGYGIRDSGGTIQIKNLNGNWTTPAGGAAPNATYLIQTANTGLPNSQAMGNLSTGIVINTAATGVQTIYAGTTCTNQFLTALSASGVSTCAAVDVSGVQATGILSASRFPALTGDVTTVAGAVATTLATVNGNVGTFGSATSHASFTVNGKGLITAASNITPQLTFTGTFFSSLNGSAITNLATANLTGTISATNFPALTGDVTSAGGSLATVVGKVGGVTISLGGAFSTSGANTLTLTTTGNTNVTLPTTGTLVNTAVTTLSSLTGVGTISSGTWNATPVTVPFGGTGLATITAHAVLVGEGVSNIAPIAGCTTGVLNWTSAASDPSCTGTPVVINDGATTTRILGGTAVAGSAATQVDFVKSITGVSDAVATPVFTITVPNTAQAATVRVTLMGSLGAGGAIGAFECSAELSGSVVVARTLNVATVPTAASAALTGSSCVAGATTITFAYSVSAVVGANNAQQTFTVNATVTKGGGGSGNHAILGFAELLNSQASGITIS